jgi:hypothetical protein
MLHMLDDPDMTMQAISPLTDGSISSMQRMPVLESPPPMSSPDDTDALADAPPRRPMSQPTSPTFDRKLVRAVCATDQHSLKEPQALQQQT